MPVDQRAHPARHDGRHGAHRASVPVRLVRIARAAPGRYWAALGRDRGDLGYAAGVFAMIAFLAVAAYLTNVPAGGPHPGAPSPGPSAPGPSARPGPRAAGVPAALHPAVVTLPADHPVAWALVVDGALVDRSVGADEALFTTASAIKVLIAADALRRGETSPARLATLTAMIVDSDNAAAERTWTAGGRGAVLARMIAACDLRQTIPDGSGWSRTAMTAEDLARVGECVRAGRAAGDGPGGTWTAWLLARMREVRGPGRFGASEVLSADAVAMKNGWVVRDDGQWHVACLALGARWTLAVMMRYPAARGLAYGADVCRSVTRQLADGP